MEELSSIFGAVKKLSISITFLLGLVVSFRIYRKWNQGEDVEESLYYWVLGLFLTSIFIGLVSKLFGF